MFFSGWTEPTGADVGGAPTRLIRLRHFGFETAARDRRRAEVPEPSVRTLAFVEI